MQHKKQCEKAMGIRIRCHWAELFFFSLCTSLIFAPTFSFRLERDFSTATRDCSTWFYHWTIKNFNLPWFRLLKRWAFFKIPISLFSSLEQKGMLASEWAFNYWWEILILALFSFFSLRYKKSHQLYKHSIYDW